jgi:hypothetical protein
MDSMLQVGLAGLLLVALIVTPILFVFGQL